MKGPRAGTAGSGDYYARRVTSTAYRASRVDKAEVILRVVGDQLGAASCVADIGTGTGIMKNVLEKRVGKPIWGFEIDIPFVEERERVVGADGCCLPVRDATFDLVILNHIYEHVPDAGALFREAWRVLRPGGAAYVSAGSRWAVLEPHYRLPFLSWLPRGAADWYLRVSRRGRSYEGVRFLGYGQLHRLMTASGFRVVDVTERALEGLLGPARGKRWRPAWAVLKLLPGWARRAVMGASPQWFFILERGEAEIGSSNG